MEEKSGKREHPQNGMHKKNKKSKKKKRKKEKKILKSNVLSVPGAKPCGSLFGGHVTNFSDLSMFSNGRA